MGSNRIMPAALPSGKQYKRFSLEVADAGIKILPDEHEIVLNIESGHYTILDWNMRYFVTDGFFNRDELRFMFVLLDRWPSYVPNDTILQVVTQQEVTYITQLLDTQSDQLLGALRVLAESCRRLMHPHGIDIQRFGSFGYKIASTSSKNSSCEAGTTVTIAEQRVQRDGWPTITQEQRQMDMQIRLEQAVARRETDACLQAAGRVWQSETPFKR